MTLRVVVVVVTMMMLATTSWAAPAPHLHWRTLKTACCDVHFPADNAAIGARVAALADDAVDNASGLLFSPPGDRIQIVLHDVADSPNGFANVVPYDRVELRAVTPESDSELAKTDDWLRLLVQHELTHVVHLDVIHGLPAVINLVIGKRWPPNALQPRAFVEGLAVYAETRFTGGGRLRSSLFSAPLRIAALKGDRWSLDDVSNSSRRPPGGSGAYVYGSFFVDFMARRYGSQFWAAYAHDYGGSVIPYAVQRSMERISGRDLALDWKDFLDEVFANARAHEARVVGRGGPTTTRRLTRLGGTIHRPAFLNDGTLIFGAAPPDGPPGIYAIRGLPNAVPTPVPLMRTTDAADVAVVDDDVVFSQTEVHDRFSSFRDLFVLQKNGRVRQLTLGQRLWQPARWPGHGRTVLAEQRSGSASRIVAVDVDSGAIVDVVEADAGEILYGPRPSPDGSRFVVSRLDTAGRRRLAIFDIAARSWQVLDDKDVDHGDHLDPDFVDDHRVVYVDDTDGIFVVVVVDLVDGARRRIVDTLGNAARPLVSPDGAGLIFADTHLDGVDLYAADIDGGAPLPATPLTALKPTPATSSTWVPTASFVDEVYSPLPTLGPRTWQGSLGYQGNLGLLASLALDGSDAAELVSWTLRANFSSVLVTPGLGATVRLTNLTLPTSFGLELRPTLADRGRTNDGVIELSREDQLRATVSVSVPLRRRRFSHALNFGAQRIVSFDHLGVTSSPDALTPTYPPSVLRPEQTVFNVDWVYSGVESYRDSVSTERGLSSFLRLRVADKLVFSDETIREVAVDVRAFQPLPGLGNHVVAAYLSGGAALDDRPGNAFFAGGFVNQSLLNDALDGSRSGGGVLRGFPVAHVAGDALAAATLEYRFPLLEFERGLETLPIFVDRLHGAIFSDAAAGFGADARRLNVAAGVGVEARLQIVVGYYGLVVVRVGYARGLTAGGVDQPYALLGVPY